MSMLKFLLFGMKKKREMAERKKVLENARMKQEEAEEIIDSIVAQVNGCGDRWFLQPMQSIDECFDNNGDTK